MVRYGNCLSTSWLSGLGGVRRWLALGRGLAVTRVCWLGLGSLGCGPRVLQVRLHHLQLHGDVGEVQGDDAEDDDADEGDAQYADHHGWRTMIGYGDELAFVPAHKQSGLYYVMTTGVCICTQTVGTICDDWRLYLNTNSRNYTTWRLACVPEHRQLGLYYVMTTGVCICTQTVGTIMWWLAFVPAHKQLGLYVMTGVLYLHTNSWDNMWWRLPFESAQKTLINWQSMWWRLPFNPAHKLLRQWLCSDDWHLNLHTNCWDNNYVVTTWVWICS